MTTTRTPSATATFIDTKRKELHSTALATATAAAEACVDLDFGLPTAGQIQIVGDLRHAQVELVDLQRCELRDAKDRQHKATTERGAAKGWTDHDPVPAFAPERSLLPVRLRQGGVLAVLVAETMLLIDPINEILRAGSGYTLEGTAGAVTITALGAFMAHARGEAWDTAESATDAEVRARADAAANRATVGILVATAAAITSRIYASTLRPDGIDGNGIAFFVALQLVFLFAALTVPQSISAARRGINRLRVAAALETATATVDDEARHITDLEAQHLTQPSQLDEAAVVALGVHLGHLADHHPDDYMADMFRTRLAQAHGDGTLRSLIDPTARPDEPAQPEDPAQPGDTDEPDDGPEEPPAEPDVPAGPHGDPPRPTPDPGAYADPDDLLNQIFNRRAS